MADESVEVAVVGGGLGGLAAAFALHDRGVPFLLLEASERWGGVVRTEVAGGFLLEGGPDAFIAQKPDATALCRELGLGPRLVPSSTQHRAVFLLRRGRPVALPEGLALGIPTRLGAFLRSPLISWPGKLRMGMEPFVRRRREDADESVADFFRRRLGAEALETLAEPLLGAIHGGDLTRLSVRAVLPRFAELERREGSLALPLWRAARKAPPAGAAFYSLEGGLAELVNALVTRLPPARRRLSTPARALRRDGSAIVVETSSGGTIRARAVVLALPPARSAHLLEPLDAPAAALLAGIRTAPSVTVQLAYRRQDVAHPLDGHGLLVPRSEGLRSTACSFVSTKFPARAPGGHVLLRVAFGGMRDPAAVDLEERAVRELAHAEMRAPLGIGGEPVMSRVYRWPAATPQMELGHLERIAEVERRLAAIPGLILTGGGIRGVGVPDVVGDGRRAAQAAAALLGDAAPEPVLHGAERP